ncbi:MAG: hypothetical protein EBU49_08300, partial [Proteobacteria bacterium]|nr:hypothetical protein [Pseudomonadota bacterium]
MADSERRHHQIRIGTTAASTAYVGHFYINDDSLLTDIGWVSGTAVTAAATAPFSLVLSAISPAAVSTNLVTITTGVPVAVTSGLT